MAIHMLASSAVVNNDDCVKFVSVESLCGGKIMMLCNKSLKNVTQKLQKKLSLNSSHFTYYKAKFSVRNTGMFFLV